MHRLISDTSWNVCHLHFSFNANECMCSIKHHSDLQRSSKSYMYFKSRLSHRSSMPPNQPQRLAQNAIKQEARYHPTPNRLDMKSTTYSPSASPPSAYSAASTAQYPPRFHSDSDSPPYLSSPSPQAPTTDCLASQAASPGSRCP